MKKILLILTFFACTQLSYGQWVHFWLRNTDTKTRAEMTATIAAAGLRLGALGKMNVDLKNTRKHLEEMKKRYYNKNSYDTKAKNSYLSKAVAGYAYQTAGTVIANKNHAMYITENKKDYIKNIAQDRHNVIASIFSTSLANGSIKSDNRQEMYRLSDELLRTFAKNNRELRQLLGVTILGELVQSTLTDDSDEASKALEFLNWSKDGSIFDTGKDNYTNDEQQYIDNQ